jgi:hypothetical protein
MSQMMCESLMILKEAIITCDLEVVKVYLNYLMISGLLGRTIFSARRFTG